MKSTKSLVIIQPYVPKYRVAFFEQLAATLADHGIICKVAASDPDALQSRRGDAVRPPWLIPITQRSISVAGRSLGLGGARTAWKDADGVIVGLLGSSLDTYMALLDRKRGRLKVGVWGHIKPYVSAGNPLDLALEKLQLNAADHVFAYTPGGAAFAQGAGVSPSKITTVMNSVDTDALAQAISQVSAEDVAEFAARLGLLPHKTLAFIGGLDESKRIGFLAEVLDSLWIEAPDLKLLVGGDGSQAELLERSVARGQCIMLGYADCYQQALVARTASALLMPGRIGLVAVDSLVLGLPIITTDWPYHAPEAEYLVEGVTRYTSENNVPAYVAEVMQFLTKRPRPLSDSDRQWEYPTLRLMVSNYVSGVLHMLGAKDDSK